MLPVGPVVGSCRVVKNVGGIWIYYSLLVGVWDLVVVMLGGDGDGDGLTPRPKARRVKIRVQVLLHREAKWAISDS